MNIKKKAIAVKLSKNKSKNGYVLIRWKNGQFGWIKQDKELRPWWSLDCII